MGIGLTVFWVIPAVLAALLLAPVSVRIENKGTFGVRLHYLFFRIRLYPLPEGGREEPAKEPKNKKEKKAAEKAVRKKAPPVSAKEGLELLQTLLPRLWRPVRRLVRGTTFAQLTLDVTVGRGDAAETAIEFGKMNARVYGALALFQNFLKIRAKRIWIAPDFTARRDEYRYSVTVRILPATVLASLLSIGFWVLWTAVKGLGSAAKKTGRKKEKPEPGQPDLAQAGNGA